MKRRPRQLALRLHTELVVDGFAGGGGASEGIEWALGRSPDIAINHDPEALLMHRTNHPNTRHFCESIFAVEPAKVCEGRRVALAWFSPDCTYHSKARGGKPFRDRDKAKRRRGLAWIVTAWAKAVRPRVIVMENVEEIQGWGPLLDDGMPDPARKGFTWLRWVARLRNLGYTVEWRELRGCDFGAPTIRKRLFVVATRDGEPPPAWPAPSHGPKRSRRFRVAADCIDWSIPTRSIFGRKKPLAENTLRRIARGTMKYVVEAAEPFIIPLTHAGDTRSHGIGEPMRTVTGAHRGELALCVPTLIQTSWGERKGQAPRVPGLEKPLGTIMAGGGKHALVAAFLAKHNAGHEATGQRLSSALHTVTTKDTKALVTSHLVKLYGTAGAGVSVTEPMPTVTANGRGGGHIAEVRAFLLKYYGTDQDPTLRGPLHTITTRDRFALVVTIHGEDYIIVDIGMRMLTPRELYRAQGFNDSYEIAPRYETGKKKGKPLSKTAQVRMVGNSVCPPLAAAIVRANCVAREARRVAA